MAQHFSDLTSLRLHCCTLPPGLLPAVAPALADRLLRYARVCPLPAFTA